MKEITYEDWQKNPTPRIMWVWDEDEELKVKRKVIYVLKDGVYTSPVLVVVDECVYETFRHCAEIVKEQKTSKGFYVYNPAGSKPSHIHESLEEAKAEAERILKLNLNDGIQEPIEVLEIVARCIPEIKIKWS